MIVNGWKSQFEFRVTITEMKTVSNLNSRTCPCVSPSSNALSCPSCEPWTESQSDRVHYYYYYCQREIGMTGQLKFAITTKYSSTVLPNDDDEEMVRDTERLESHFYCDFEMMRCRRKICFKIEL